MVLFLLTLEISHFCVFNVWKERQIVSLFGVIFIVQLINFKIGVTSKFWQELMDF